MASIHFNVISKIPIFLALLLLTGHAWAVEHIISTKLDDGKTVTAEYRPGKPGSSTVLILHGFLQTRNYLTVSNLAEAAADAGHTVLMPTLSLGVNERKKSLQCDAVHTHSFQDDVAEIDFWLKWLEKKGHNRIVLIGHSYGSLHLLGYLIDNPNKNISQFIATSLLDVSREIPREKFEAYINDAKERHKDKDNSLNEYSISYCNKYVSPAYAYLSYVSWSRKSILDSVKNINVPVTVILGGKDKRLDAAWESDLINNGAKVVMIDGANHFFSADQEFDLQDAIQMLLP